MESDLIKEEFYSQICSDGKSRKMKKKNHLSSLTLSEISV